MGKSKGIVRIFQLILKEFSQLTEKRTHAHPSFLVKIFSLCQNEDTNKIQKHIFQYFGNYTFWLVSILKYVFFLYFINIFTLTK